MLQRFIFVNLSISSYQGAHSVRDTLTGNAGQEPLRRTRSNRTQHIGFGNVLKGLLSQELVVEGPERQQVTRGVTGCSTAWEKRRRI